jgi:ribosomal protein S18 acetylase RimI-like enzyme
MKDFKIIDRELTSEELEQMRAGFNRNSLDHGVVPQTADRYGFVAQKRDVFIGCSSGLAYKDGDQYSGWFYLTDLFVDKEYRLQGLGSKLLGMLEEKIISMGLKQIWTWTAGYEAPEFYLKQGYQIFAALENWYSDGSSRIGLRKELEKDHNR